MIVIEKQIYKTNCAQLIISSFQPGAEAGAELDNFNYKIFECQNQQQSLLILSALLTSLFHL